jgi:hypothetical protein
MDRSQKSGLILALLILAAFLLAPAQWPPEKTPIADFRYDALAEKYCPVIVQGKGIEPPPSHIYYRMGQDDGRILIAYHVAWPFEKDETKGVAAAWNKMFYTGGLKLQRKIFGPEDIEVIEFVIDKKSGQVIRLRYETATVSKEGDQVKQNHLNKEETRANPPVYLETITWNHMFGASGPDQVAGKQVYKLKPEYFTQDRWDYYQMSKKRQSLLSQDRAYYDWELLDQGKK